MFCTRKLDDLSIQVLDTTTIHAQAILAAAS